MTLGGWVPSHSHVPMTMRVELNRAGVDTDGIQKSENEQERRATYSLSRRLLVHRWCRVLFTSNL